MRRLRRNERPGAARGGNALVRLATSAATAGSKLETQYWDARLTEVVRPLLTATGQHTIEAALDRLWTANGRGYDLLADVVESTIEVGSIARDAGGFDTLMFIVPALAWSHTRIAHGPMRQADLDALAVQLGAHVFAPQARIALVTRLLTPDQLPNSYHEEAVLARELAAAAIDGKHLTLRADRVPEAIDFVADARYVIGAVAVPAGQPVFAWQSDDITIEAATEAWTAQGGAVFGAMLAGTHCEVLMPGAFYSTLRRIDRTARVFYLRAGVAFLETTLGRPAAQLGAAFAPFYENELVEYRIGLTVGREDEVYHGVTWPILSEDDAETAPEQIREVLTQAGISQIFEHEHRFPLEFCDDCGAPLFPNAQGDVVHAELPEDAEPPHMHLH